MYNLTNIGFIGGGKMAQSLAGGFVRKKLLKAEQIYFYDRNNNTANTFLKELPGAILLESNKKLVEKTDIIFCAVKPQNIEEVALSLIEVDKENKLFISILAGVCLASLYNHLQTKRIVRVMPNTPCLIGQGASGYSLGKGATNEDGSLVKIFFEAVGIALQVDEKHLDVVTAISGSGPAYIYTVIEALIEGAVKEGLSREIAEKLIVQTVIGSASLAQQTGSHPAVLKAQVTSPGGTTAAALYTLEKGRTRAIFMEAVSAATKRSQELGKPSERE